MEDENINIWPNKLKKMATNGQMSLKMAGNGQTSSKEIRDQPKELVEGKGRPKIAIDEKRSLEKGQKWLKMAK